MGEGASVSRQRQRQLWTGRVTSCRGGTGDEEGGQVPMEYLAEAVREVVQERFVSLSLSSQLPGHAAANRRGRWPALLVQQACRDGVGGRRGLTAALENYAERLSLGVAEGGGKRGSELQCCEVKGEQVGREIQAELRGEAWGEGRRSIRYGELAEERSDAVLLHLMGNLKSGSVPSINLARARLYSPFPSAISRYASQWQPPCRAQSSRVHGWLEERR
jgi:hypothetical protein